jgi:negative regulator of flagellin synthesis FlgM
MNISDKVTLQQPSVIKSVQPAQKAAQPIKTTAQTPPAQGDRVQISDQAREMQAARQAVAQMPEVDEEKVARIKTQIQNGTYKVDGRKVADNMLAESLLGDR